VLGGLAGELHRDYWAQMDYRALPSSSKKSTGLFKFQILEAGLFLTLKE